jgi:hypothetical protein
VEDFYYIGGYYGASSELAMMKEIRARGPIAADLNVPLDKATLAITDDTRIRVSCGRARAAPACGRSSRPGPDVPAPAPPRRPPSPPSSTCSTTVGAPTEGTPRMACLRRRLPDPCPPPPGPLPAQAPRCC